MKILPSFETSIALGACKPCAIISTPFELVRFPDSDTGDGNGTRVSEGEYFMVIILTIMTRTEGITYLTICLLSIRFALNLIFYNSIQFEINQALPSFNQSSIILPAKTQPWIQIMNQLR
jgi:hypothetical protein